jgi:ubiquinone biosynthesis protein COQ9
MTRGVTSNSNVEPEKLFGSLSCSRLNPSHSKDSDDEMYRTAAKLVLLLRAPSGWNSNSRLRFPPLRFSTSVNHNQHPETPNFSDPTSSTSTSTSTLSSSSNWSASSTAEEARRQESRRPRVEHEDEQARVLRASLLHVVRALFQ